MAINIIPLVAMGAGIAYLVTKKNKKSDGHTGGDPAPVIKDIVKNGLEMHIVDGECASIKTISLDGVNAYAKAFAALYIKTNPIPKPPTREWAEKYFSSLLKSTFPSCNFPPTWNGFEFWQDGISSTWDQNVDMLYHILKFANDNGVVPLPGSGSQYNIGYMLANSILE